MLNAGTYLRGLWKQKPQAWGPVSQVQSVLRTRFEDWYGVAWSITKGALPFWEKDGQYPYNYADNNQVASITNSFTWGNDGIELGSSDFVYLDFEEEFLADAPETCCFLCCMDGPARGELKFIAGLYTSNSTRMWGIFQSSSSDYRYQSFWHRTNSAYYNNTVAGKVFVCNSRSATDHSFFIDGSKIATSTTDITYSYNYNYDRIVLGNVNGTLSANQILIFSAGLEDNQVQKLTDNPWSLWQPPTFRTFSIPGTASYAPTQFLSATESNGTVTVTTATGTDLVFDDTYGATLLRNTKTMVIVQETNLQTVIYLDSMFQYGSGTSSMSGNPFSANNIQTNLNWYPLTDNAKTNKTARIAQYQDQAMALTSGQAKTSVTGHTALGSDGFFSDGAWHFEEEV